MFSLAIHADLQPYLLFADGDHGTFYRSNLDGSGIQRLVTGLPYPGALDFDYRYYMQSGILFNLIANQNLSRVVNREHNSKSEALVSTQLGSV